MEASEIKKLLNDTHLFAGVSDAALSGIASVAREEILDANTMLYESGDDTLDLYVLASGSVRFVLGERSSTAYSGTVMRSRMIIGWAALVPDHPKRIGTAECMEKTTLLAMNGDKVLEVLRDNPEAGMKVMERLCGMISRNFVEQGK